MNNSQPIVPPKQFYDDLLRYPEKLIIMELQYDHLFEGL